MVHELEHQDRGGTPIGSPTPSPSGLVPISGTACNVRLCLDGAILLHRRGGRTASARPRRRGPCSPPTPGRSTIAWRRHRSAKPGHLRLVEQIGQHALFDLGMRLGEASGATLGFGVLKAAVACHTGILRRSRCKRAELTPQTILRAVFAVLCTTLSAAAR
ncbi:MAG: nicotinate-nucleotide--dimethylbenzimidazole phosphoribosyltransferase [Stellaceae bacterium]